MVPSVLESFTGVFLLFIQVYEPLTSLSPAQLAQTVRLGELVPEISPTAIFLFEKIFWCVSLCAL